MHPYLPPTSLILSLLPLLLGLNALLRPHSALRIFHFPLPADPPAANLALGLARIYGARNAAIGLSLLGMWAYAAWAPIGWTFLVGFTLMAGTDGWVVRRVAGTGREWEHWGLVPVGWVVGWGLVRAGA